MSQVSQKQCFFVFFCFLFVFSKEVLKFTIIMWTPQNSSKLTLFTDGGANMILDVIIHIMALFAQYKSQSKWFKLEQSLSPLNAGLRTLTLSIRVEIACSGHIRSGRWTWLQWPLLPGCSWPSDPKTHLLHSTVFQGILTLCCVQSNWRSNFLAGTPKSALCSLHCTVELNPLLRYIEILHTPGKPRSWEVKVVGKKEKNFGHWNTMMWRQNIHTVYRENVDVSDDQLWQVTLRQVWLNTVNIHHALVIHNWKSSKNHHNAFGYWHIYLLLLFKSWNEMRINHYKGLRKNYKGLIA